VHCLVQQVKRATMSWGKNEEMACVVSIGAGLATGIGGLSVFMPELMEKVPKATLLALALALSAGVMIYVSFIEIFVKSKDSILTGLEEVAEEPTDKEDGAAAGITTACFFAGMAICAGLEMIVHKMHHKFSIDGLDGHELVDPKAPDPAEITTVKMESGLATSTTQDNTVSPPPSPPGHNGCSHDHGDSKQPSMLDILNDSDLLNSDKGKKHLKHMGAMTALAIALHNFPEGLATFLATVDDPSVGIGLGVAIAVHNIPEGVCVAMPVYYATGSKWKGFMWSLLSGITEPIGGIVGYAALKPVFTDMVFGIVFSMVGGMMVFIVIHELLPSAHRYMPEGATTVTGFVVAGMVIMAISLVLFGL